MLRRLQQLAKPMTKPDTSKPVLRLRGITKRFPGVLANDNVDFELAKGEIHALLGENGAGKTTLMNVVYGLYQQDEGQIFINGKEITIRDPNDALENGIGMVHQHFMLVPVMTVTENLMLGHEALHGLPVGSLGQLDKEKVSAEVKILADKHGLTINPDAYVQDLSVGERQRVEIVKALYRGAEVLILDEPTAVLTPQEVDELFEIMRSLTKQGKSIIFITHKLGEVLEIADRISVIRDGKVVGTATPKDADQRKLASMMVGRDVLLRVDKKSAKPGKVVLELQNLIVLDESEKAVVNEVSFTVREGEILGVAGVQGNGQTELVEAITGLSEVFAGEVKLLGQDVTSARPRKITELGTAHIPEDRRKDGLVLPFPVSDNLFLNTYYKDPFSKGTVLDESEMAEAAADRIEKFDIRTPSSSTSVGSLSGGNQQKVIVARELSRPVKLIVAAQPTRGLDVGSIEYIHNRLIESRDKGVAVLLVSSELDEIMQLSDRIAVMYRGKIINILDAKKANKEDVGLLMAGVEKA